MEKAKQLKRNILLFFLPRLVWVLLWILYLTCRNRFYISKKLEETNCIATFWHGEFLMLPFAYLKLRKKPKIFVISSKHFDGELMVRLYSYFGFKTIRGSTNYDGVNRGGVKVLKESFKYLKDGWDTGITPDGPKGPYHSIADGVVAMGQKTQTPLSVFRVRPHKCWRLNTWDRFEIPKPFSKIDYYLMDPFILKKEWSVDDAKIKIYEKMQAL
ncbi:lysophospholipid acyltransferase family protein [Helicobacter anatolicus]|uniref:lysophospholipid acyltransferase family protein n=1 Tax=Helicobacter anatolicus TaxID=2905874 RepID=UPI001E44945F|nr:lysophospholipid acyltransferase family protein [Helicobacter anatolicus]MCE3039649.1 lysophospholipid acyltransferase family protein [Helicobacter anatolicus]